MKTKVKDKVIDAVTFICLVSMVFFAHGCKLWCTSITIVFGMLALILQNCIRTKEEEGDEYDF